MIGQKRVLAIIPARGGSKRIHNKNIVDFYGKPLIYWSIFAGLQSDYIDTVLVSTDDGYIANLSRTLGALVPFIRPNNISGDLSPTIEVVRHAVKYMMEIGENYDYILLLQPTSPLRTSSHIDSAIKFMIEKDANAIIGVTEVDHPLEWANLLPEDCLMDNFISRMYDGVRSQDLQNKYRINGAIYLCKLELVLRHNSLVNIPSAYGFVMERFSSIDIDTTDDLFCALMYKKYYNKFKNDLNKNM
jgi:CMP-N-acetylneuraminic acid synthetase